MRNRNKLFAILVGIVLGGSGCALPGTVAGLNEAQINALVKMKDAGVMCITGSGPPLTGSGSVVVASIDKGIKGSLEVGRDCSIKIVTQ